MHPRGLTICAVMLVLAGCADCEYPPWVASWNSAGAFQHLRASHPATYNLSWENATSGLPLDVEPYGRLVAVYERTVGCEATCPVIQLHATEIWTSARSMDPSLLRSEFQRFAPKYVVANQTTLDAWTNEFSTHGNVSLPNGTSFRLSEAWAAPGATTEPYRSIGRSSLDHAGATWVFQRPVVRLTAQSVDLSVDSSDDANVRISTETTELARPVLEKIGADLGIPVPANPMFQSGVKC